MIKSVYGKDGFEAWLQAAVSQNRLLYLNKKETELILNGKLTHTVQDHSALQPRNDYPLAQDVSGFYIENIRRYREAVKAKFGERPAGACAACTSGPPLSLGFCTPTPKYTLRVSRRSIFPIHR